MADAIPNITFEIAPADVVTVPIDDSLSVAGEAADAKAVGDALANKANRSELSNAVKVNGQGADLQGEIVLLAGHIPMNANAGAPKVGEKIAELDGRTGANIPVNEEPGSPSIAEAMDAAAAGAQIAGGVATLTGSIADASREVHGLSVNGVSLPIRDSGAVRSVNGETIDANGDVRITSVEIAENLKADDAQVNEACFALRTSGGTTSIADGKAWLTKLRGNMEHTGVVAEQLTLTVTAPRETGVDAITATIDADTFKGAVSESGTITLTYTTEWSANPELIGVTVTGEPVSGDTIVIVYVKADRGTITPATPTSFRSTGWNLYSHAAGYARVVKYSNQYGFRVEGAFTGLAFSETLTGERTVITPAAGNFNVPGDGYVWVTGGNATSTAIYMTWSDWTEGYEGSFAAYSESVIDLTDLMSDYYPDGLLAVGAVADEIDLSTQKATVAVEKLSYSDEAIAALEQAGRAYVADSDTIYAVLVTPVVHDIQIGSEYTVNDHGMEYFAGTAVTVDTQTLYGQNLRDKLRTDVLTISPQQLTAEQKTQARGNIGALGTGDVVNNLTSGGTTVPLSAEMGKSLTLRGSLGSNDDLNNLTSASTNGLYYITTGVANSPISWGALISIMVEDVGSQIVISGRTIYTRTRAGSPHAWSEWGVILTSVTGGLDCRFVSSGSMKSIKGSGVYYISNSVTDKPFTSGGMLILADATGTGDTMTGLYQPNSVNVGPFRVSVVNGTWSYST